VKNVITKLWKLDVKTNYYCICENYPIWKSNDFGKKLIFNTLVDYHQPIYQPRKLIEFS